MLLNNFIGQIKLKIEKGCLCYDLDIVRLNENKFLVIAKDMSGYAENFKKEMDLEELQEFLNSFKILEWWKMSI